MNKNKLVNFGKDVLRRVLFDGVPVVILFFLSFWVSEKFSLSYGVSFASLALLYAILFVFLSLMAKNFFHAKKKGE